MVEPTYSPVNQCGSSRQKGQIVLHGRGSSERTRRDQKSFMFEPTIVLRANRLSATLTWPKRKLRACLGRLGPSLLPISEDGNPVNAFLRPLTSFSEGNRNRSIPLFCSGARPQTASTALGRCSQPRRPVWLRKHRSFIRSEMVSWVERSPAESGRHLYTMTS